MATPRTQEAALTIRFISFRRGRRLRAPAIAGCALACVLGAPASAFADQPPTADFYFFPTEPTIGQTVDFVSASSDPESPIEQRWDLDGDGRYDDGSGEHVTWAYDATGVYQVGIQVSDGPGGHVVTATKVINVQPLEPPPPTLMTPFPIVRIAGAPTRSGARVRRLTIRSPNGARVTVRCRGVGCPRRRQSTISDGHARFHRFERRYRAGAVLAIYVTERNRIGKYTRFRIRRGASPARLDRCLQPGSTAPSPCPAT